MKQVEYPTPKELDFFPKNGIYYDRDQFWYEPWQSIDTHKKFLTEKGETLIEELGRAPLPTEYGDFTYIVFGDKTNHGHHELLVYGNIDEGSLGEGENILTRVHSACRTNEVYHAVNCECRKEIERTLTDIAGEGRGVLVYLEQEGRGTGITGKMAQLNGMFEWQDGKVQQRTDENGERIDTDRAYKEAGYPSECRDFTIAGQMLSAIGVKSVQLMTNNPQKIQAMLDAGIDVIPVEIHIKDGLNDIIRSDLRSKAKNLGHTIQESDLYD